MITDPTVTPQPDPQPALDAAMAQRLKESIADAQRLRLVCAIAEGKSVDEAFEIAIRGTAPEVCQQGQPGAEA